MLDRLRAIPISVSHRIGHAQSMPSRRRVGHCIDGELLGVIGKCLEQDGHSQTALQAICYKGHPDGQRAFYGSRNTTPAPNLRLFCTFVVAFGNCVRTQFASKARTERWGDKVRFTPPPA